MLHLLGQMALVLAGIAALLAAAHLAYRPPPLAGRSMSRAIAASPETLLGRLALEEAARQDFDSGVIPLLDGPGAFAARIALIRTAEVSLDVQYYIWSRDATGLILLDELRRAAGRGVRIRLLLDDNGIVGLDGELAALDSLPQVEVRLFNPFILRRIKPLGFAFDFVRLNRRMHNKSLTADGAVGILGGRNIGDIYFGFANGVQFVDADVLVAGRIAAEIGADFDRYWHSGSSHPIASLVAAPSAGGLERLAVDAGLAAARAGERLHVEHLQGSDLINRIAAGELAFEWTGMALVSDDPAKGLGRAAQKDHLFPQLMALLARPARSVDLVSAYFIPGRRFSKRLERLAKEGVRIRILTNSQAATDVLVVHSAYVRYRPRLLRAGVGLYELRPDFAIEDDPAPRRLTGSRASLHSKTLAIDEERIFIGSFNFDPRSLLLNTEMGLLIDSPSIAGALAGAFVDRFASASYAPVCDGRRVVGWEETGADGTLVRHRIEPGTNPASRMLLRILGLLPIEWLL